MRSRFISIPTPARRGDVGTVRGADMARQAISVLQNWDRAIKTSRPRPWAEAMFHVVAAVDFEYLICKRLWRGATLGTENVYIARPRLLRCIAETLDGVTYTPINANSRTASNGSDPDETQTVTYPYLAGDVIEATPGRGNTGVTIVDQQRGRLIDMNIDGRMWGVDAPP